MGLQLPSPKHWGLQRPDQDSIELACPYCGCRKVLSQRSIYWPYGLGILEYYCGCGAHIQINPRSGAMQARP